MNTGAFRQTLSRYAQHVSSPYVDYLRRVGLDVEIVRAEQATVTDASGRTYIDCIAGYGNANVGHNHPRVREALVAALHASQPFNWPFVSHLQAELAERLAGVAPPGLECSFFVSSGTEAVDSALKLARLATGRPDFISAHGAWHGFSLAALSVSERRLCRDFEPLLGGVTQVPYGDIEAVDAHIDDRTAAVIVEPIQAESGAVVPPDRYLRGLREVCDRRDVVLVLDEVKTGIGKTGRMFACQHDDVAPDILLSGKSLGGGFMPIGAMTAKRSLWTKFGLSFPMASSSGAGNLLACAAALATLEVVEAEGLCEQASRKGEFLKQALSEIACEFPSVIKGTSGRGLLLALHADGLKTANALVRECIRGGVLVMTAFCDRTKVLLEPPLCISDEQLHTVATTVRDAARKLAEAPRSPASTPA